MLVSDKRGLHFCEVSISLHCDSRILNIFAASLDLQQSSKLFLYGHEIFQL
jgi:hypothetical protein